MSLFRGERPVLGATTIRYDGTGDPITIQNEAGTTVFKVTSTGATTASGTTTIAASTTLAVTTADKLTVGGVIIPQTATFTFPLSATMPDADVFIAPAAIQILSVNITASVAGGSGAVLDLRKITDTSAPGAAASSTVKEFFATPNANMNSITVNTVTTPTLTSTAADLLCASGNRIAVNMGGTLTNLVGQVTVVYQRV